MRGSDAVSLDIRNSGFPSAAVPDLEPTCATRAGTLNLAYTNPSRAPLMVFVRDESMKPFSAKSATGLWLANRGSAAASLRPSHSGWTKLHQRLAALTNRVDG